MTEEQLNAIRKRAEAATDGPWEFLRNDNVLLTLSKDCVVPEIAEEFSHCDDGDFVARARQDVPDLLAEVERLREIIRDARKSIGELEVNHLGGAHYSTFIKLRMEDLTKVFDGLKQVEGEES